MQQDKVCANKISFFLDILFFLDAVDAVLTYLRSPILYIFLPNAPSNINVIQLQRSYIRVVMKN